MYCRKVKDMDNSVLFDRLASCFQLYVQNYALKNNNIGRFRIQPLYDVDYEVNLNVLEKYTESVDGHWLHLISGCNDINELPYDLREQVVKCIPFFLEQYPQYENAECLKVNNK